MNQTVHVRIAVVVDAEGHWNAEGWFFQDDEPSDTEMMNAAREAFGPSSRRVMVEHFIEADVPLPESKTVKGKTTE